MHNTVKNLIYIEELIKSKANHDELPKIIAVSKTFPIENILPLIDHGHLHYGENKVQEALDKWTDIKNQNKNIKLHLIGRLQSNKVKFALKIFDYIHSLDSERLATKIAEEQLKQGKKLKIFIQVNIGEEPQKAGVSPQEADDFIAYCKELGLPVVGLMCIPPLNENASECFKVLKNLAEKNSFSAGNSESGLS